MEDITKKVINIVQKISSTRVTNGVLALGILFLVVNITTAATPNPGHPWTEVGDGLIQFTAPTALRTYTLPNTDADILTDYNLQQGDLLYADAASSTARLPKDTNATRYLSNTGASNAPAWSLVSLLNGVSGILPATSGGTGNASTSFTGQTVSRTYTLPDADATILTTNSPVSLAQGGTGASLTVNNGGILYSNASNLAVSAGTSTVGKILMSASNFIPTWSQASYSSTTGSFGDVLVSVGNNFEARPNVPNFTNRTMAVFANAANTTATNIGFPAAPTLTTTVTNADDTIAPWLNHATTATSGNTSGVISAAFTYFYRDWSPKFSAFIKTDASAITTIGYWVGMFSAAPDNSTAPNIHAAAFRYYTSVDGTAFWRTVTIAGTGASATVTTTSVPIAANTAYKLNIDCSASASNCRFYINGVLVSTHTTTLPASGTKMGYGARVTTLAASARNLKWSKISITHD